MATGKMENRLNLILSISCGLIVLILMEGLITMGNAFNFEKYDAIDYIFQLLAVTFTVCLCIKISIEE